MPVNHDDGPDPRSVPGITSGRLYYVLVPTTLSPSLCSDTIDTLHPHQNPDASGETGEIVQSIETAGPLDLGPLVHLAEDLLGQTHGVGERIVQAVERVTHARARLLLAPQARPVQPGPMEARGAALTGSGTPVCFAGRAYGTLFSVYGPAAVPPFPALPAGEIERLAQTCSLILHLLEQAALIDALMQHLPPLPIEPLTSREREVLLWIARGEAPEQIAKRLHIAPKTVDKHQEHIYEKLQVHCFLDAILVAHRAGITRYVTPCQTQEDAVRK